MSTLRQAYWRLVRRRPLILFWSLWLPIEDVVTRWYHRLGRP